MDYVFDKYKLFWVTMRRNDPRLYRKIYKYLRSKDIIPYRHPIESTKYEYIVDVLEEIGITIPKP